MSPSIHIAPNRLQANSSTLRETTPEVRFDPEATIQAIRATGAQLLEVLSILRYNLAPAEWDHAHAALVPLARTAIQDAAQRVQVDISGFVKSQVGPVLERLLSFDQRLANDAFATCSDMVVPNLTEATERVPLPSQPELWWTLDLTGCTGLERLPDNLHVRGNLWMGQDPKWLKGGRPKGLTVDGDTCVSRLDRTTLEMVLAEPDTCD